LLACNTTAGHNIVLEFSCSASIPVNSKYLGPDVLPDPHSFPVPLDIYSVLAAWIAVEAVVLEFVALDQDWSILLPSCVANNLSYLQVSYFSYDIYSEFGTYIPQKLFAWIF